MPPLLTRDDGNALGITLLLKTAGANNAHDRNNTTINHNDCRGQNVAEPATRWEDNGVDSNGDNDSQADGKTDSQVGSKDLMLSSEKEAIKQNQACQEEAL